MRLFLDIDVLLDVLANREPWSVDSAEVLTRVESEDAHGVAAAHSIPTLYYLLAKHLGRDRTTSVLVDLLQLLSVAPLDHDTIVEALSLAWSDFEDALQMLSAKAVKADYVVTRNVGDFESDDVPVVTPTELLAILAAREEEKTE